MQSGRNTRNTCPTCKPFLESTLLPFHVPPLALLLIPLGCSCKKITVAPGTESKVYSPMQALLYYHSKKKKKPNVSTETVQHAAHPPQHYLHTLHQLMNNGFPLRVKVSGGRGMKGGLGSHGRGIEYWGGQG